MVFHQYSPEPFVRSFVHSILSRFYFRKHISAWLCILNWRHTVKTHIQPVKFVGGILRLCQAPLCISFVLGKQATCVAHLCIENEIGPWLLIFIPFTLQFAFASFPTLTMIMFMTLLNGFSCAVAEQCLYWACTFSLLSACNVSYVSFTIKHVPTKACH